MTLDELVRALGVGIPASAVAVIIVVKLFLNRMKESQSMGHGIAKDLATENRAALKLVVENHEKVMQGVTDRFEVAMNRQADKNDELAHEVRELCVVIRSKLPQA